MFVVDRLSEAATIAAQHGDVLVVDLENTLVDYGSTEEQRHKALTTAVEVIATTTAAADGLQRLAFITNGPFALPELHHDALEIHTVSAARKPYVRLPPLRRIRSLLVGATVYGDQPLTDGMLAHNLGGIWLQPRSAHEPIDGEPLWPRVMRAAGQRAIRRHFVLTDWAPTQG